LKAQPPFNFVEFFSTSFSSAASVSAWFCITSSSAGILENMESEYDSASKFKKRKKKPVQTYGNILRGAKTKCLLDVGFAEGSIKLLATQ